MPKGILICGLNGCGKTTLGQALAERLLCPFIDIEDVCFPRRDAAAPYDAVPPRDEVERRLMERVQAYGRFVFAAVRGDYRISAFCRCAVRLCVPPDVRMKRIRERSFRAFGERMLPGGDLYEREEAFFRMAASRTERDAAGWPGSLGIRCLRVDGTRPVEETVYTIIKEISDEWTNETA